MRRVLCASLNCPILVLSLALALVGCNYTRPQSAANPLSLTVKKPSQHPALPLESDYNDDSIYYGHSRIHRNLPLEGTRWEWEGGSNAQGFQGLPNASGYRIEFKPDGWFDLQADCKRGAGMYEANGWHIALTVIQISHAACPRDSQADDFLTALEAARTYRLNDSKLFFDNKHQTDTMIFHLQP